MSVAGGAGIPAFYTAGELTHLLADQLRRLRFGIGREAAIQFQPRFEPQFFRVDPAPPCRGQAAVAEAQAEQETAEAAELDEVPLVMEAVLEAMEVEGLRNHRRHALARDVSAEGYDVGPHVGIGRAEIGEVRVTECVVARAFWMGGAERVVVQKDSPGAHPQGACGRLATELGEDIRLPGEGADPGLQFQAAIPCCIRPEEDAVTIQEVHLSRRVVWKDVAALVVGGRHRDAAQPGTARRVVQHPSHTLVRKVAGERE